LTALSWEKLDHEAPEVAAFGKSRIDGKVSYLATVRGDGFPRIHPVTAIVGESRCFMFAEPGSSKVKDFRSNDHFCLHCGMSDSSGSSGEFQITGEVIQIEDDQIRAEAESICSYRPAGRYLLYELKISEAIATAYRGGRPNRKRWTASG
jgi:hypothetical protein|tara:strand:- start:492 stop:941 length:450 start_codon:yes stop_codon:yes gene_type:complete